ncbi:MAG: DUF4350 domain-containing protein [Prevotella sp.]|nr:DUF4350 domain-containing protein [Prevotella sp.]
MNRRFIIFIGCFLLFVFLLEWKIPAKFVWNPTFNHKDRQPFGCAVFDSLLQQSVPAGYRVTDKTFAQLEREHWRRPHAILVQAVDFQPTETDLRAMDRLLKAGNKVLIAASDMQRDSLSTDFGVTINGSDTFSPRWVKQSLETQSLPYDTLSWAHQAPYPDASFRVYSSMVYGEVNADSIVDYEALVTYEYPRVGDAAEDVTDVDEETAEPYTVTGTVDSSLVAHSRKLIAVKRGKGEIFFCCTPLLLTNYGILDRQTNVLLFRMLSQFRGLPIVRTEAYTPKSELNQETPLRFFLQHEALRWAVYMALAGLLLFCVFFARRRQRVVPVVKAPGNKSLEFVRLIGTLYHQRHVNRDLLQKKYGYFAESLRRQLMIDVENTEVLRENVAQIAQRTGLAEADVRMILERTHRHLTSQEELTDADLRRTIDGMDMILNNL